MHSTASYPYVTGGVSIGDITQDIVGQPFGVAKRASFNWTAGAGLEFVVSGPLTAKLEYLYVNHTRTDCTAECNGGHPHGSQRKHFPRGVELPSVRALTRNGSNSFL
jgi:opacity protein-like surface antigen